MKKQILYLILSLVTMLAATGCYKDDGNYDYRDLADFYVDPEGLPAHVTVPIFSVVELEPGLVYGGDRSDLEFAWRVYNGYSKPGTSPAVVISTDENLSAPVSVLPGEYTLEFRATETTTGRITTHRLNMTVESSGSGILVLYEEDGHVDCGMITPSILFGDRDKDAVAYRMYSSVNPDYPLTGAPVAIEMLKFSNAQYINILTENDMVRMSLEDMNIENYFAEMFSFPPSTTRPQAISVPYLVFGSNAESSDGLEMMVNNGTVYVNTVLLGMGNKTFYGERTLAGGYEAAPWIFYAAPNVIAYDQRAGRFMSSMVMMSIFSAMSAPLGTIGKEAVYMGYGFGGGIVNAVFTDKDDRSKRYFYVVNVSGNAIRNSWDISHYTRITNATQFVFARRGLAAFYAASNTVYQIKYDMTGDEIGENATTAWSAPSDETITAMELCPYQGRNFTVAKNERDSYLFVATYNESTNAGKVYILDVNIETDGSLSSSPMGIYEGFGRICDFGFKF